MRCGMVGKVVKSRAAGIETADETRIARQFVETIPHARALGMVITEIGEGVAEIRMPYDARFVGDPASGVMHGGAVSALMAADESRTPQRCQK